MGKIGFDRNRAFVYLQIQTVFMSIEVKAVTKAYGEQLALNNVSFSIGSSEIVGFLGPNGAGKSTMMKIITSYIPQTKGEVKVCGFDNMDQSIELKKQIGYLPEHNPLYLEMYVKEYLEFVAKLYKVPKSRVDDMIQLTGLEREYRKKIQSLSKGYRQRIGLAQALIHDPKVLILDEPTTGLDPNQLVEIRDLIRNVGKEKTVMLSTHIMQEVEAICDRVIIINQGNLVADSPTEDLKNLQNNQQILSVGFNAEVEKSFLLDIEGVSQVSRDGHKRWKIYYSSQKDIREALFQKAVQNGKYFTHLEVKDRNLEEVFHSLTK